MPVDQSNVVCRRGSLPCCVALLRRGDTQGHLVVKNSDSFAVLCFAFTLDRYTDAVSLSLSLLPRTRRGVVTSI